MNFVSLLFALTVMHEHTGLNIWKDIQKEPQISCAYFIQENELQVLQFIVLTGRMYMSKSNICMANKCQTISEGKESSIQLHCQCRFRPSQKTSLVYFACISLGLRACWYVISPDPVAHWTDYSNGLLLWTGTHRKIKYREHKSAVMNSQDWIDDGFSVEHNTICFYLLSCRLDCLIFIWNMETYSKWRGS